MKLAFGFLIFFFVSLSHAHNIAVKGWSRLKTEGITRQTTDFSCGPAALSLLLKDKHGVIVSEMEILSDIIYRSEVGSDVEKIKNGFSLFDLKVEAIRLGFQAKGVKYESYKNISGSLPIIILLENDLYSHFVVLQKIQDDYAELLDPEVGKVRMPLYILKSQWKGYALITDYNDDAQ